MLTVEGPEEAAAGGEAAGREAPGAATGSPVLHNPQ